MTDTLAAQITATAADPYRMRMWLEAHGLTPSAGPAAVLAAVADTMRRPPPIAPGRVPVYISGPITGLDTEVVRKAFGDAAAELAGAGYQPVDPTLLPVPGGCGCIAATGTAGTGSGHEWSCYLRKDIAALVYCQAILLLPGWETSRGARLERTVAEALGLQVWWETPAPAPVSG